MPALAVTAMLSVGMLTSVGAQGMGDPPLGATAADCEQLAKLPNAPVSVETCKAMLGMAAGMNAAGGDPGGQRPGDALMTCPQIFAELQTMAGVGISELNIARSEAVVNEGVVLANKQAAELTTFMIASFALGQAMGAASVVMPGFVAQAIAMAWAAQFVALGAKAQAAQAPLNAQMSEIIQSSSGELMHSMQANPRFRRLGQLAMAKECEAPAAKAR
ncbi:MAG: hypothetical protein ABIO63_06905 [Casimicrobiaceae bacterium]